MLGIEFESNFAKCYIYFALRMFPYSINVDICFD